MPNTQDLRVVILAAGEEVASSDDTAAVRTAAAMIASATESVGHPAMRPVLAGQKIAAHLVAMGAV